MKTVEKLKAKLASIGANLDESNFIYHCDAPSGYVWAATGCRIIVIQYSNTKGQCWVDDAISKAMPEINQGLQRVTDPGEIERHRYETGDDEWGA